MADTVIEAIDAYVEPAAIQTSPMMEVAPVLSAATDRGVMASLAALTRSSLLKVDTAPSSEITFGDPHILVASKVHTLAHFKLATWWVASSLF
jgi:hypothetical protein